MKNTVLICGLILACACTSRAQATVWHDATSSNPEAVAVRQVMDGLYASLNKADVDKAFRYYSEESAVITLDGAFQSDASKTEDSFAEMLKSIEPKPIFSYTNLQIRLVSDDTAIAVCDSRLEHKGVTVGLARACDLLRKKAGVWTIEFEQMTPVPLLSNGKYESAMNKIELGFQRTADSDR